MTASDAPGTVIVTGAGKGIGRETALALAAGGWSIAALSRTAADLESLGEAIAGRVGFVSQACDLADAGAAREAVRKLIAASTAPVTGLVNSAGIVRLASVLDTTAGILDETLAVNTVAPLVVSQEVVRHWLDLGQGGAIVQVSSIAARVGTPLHAAYCASKAALDALTRVMAIELGPKGIRVNSVNPVVTLTPMGEQAWSDPARARPMLARIPLGRFAASQDIASVIAFLLGPGAAMIHGACLDVDGGFRAG